MLFTYNWAKEFIPSLSETPAVVAEKLSNTLAEVEAIHRLVADDYTFEIENKALSHRADLFSQIGLSREIAAGLELDFVLPPVKKLTKAIGNLTPQETVKIEVQDPALCPRYSAVIIHNVTVEESPTWLKNRLISVGLRPINTIVDITNYLMYKYGQPLHAFDLSQLQESNGAYHIQVRNARSGEELTLLDKNVLQLAETDLLICNNQHPIALAGVMGGQSAEIRAQTTDILIESANFDMYSVRTTSRRHGIRSDASLRFEKGIDPELTTPTLLEAIEMITQTADSSTIFDLYNPPETKPRILKLDHRVINYYLNIDLSINKIKAMLERLAFEVEIQHAQLKVLIPSHRKDVTLPEDLYEEIGRLYDYNNIKPTLPTDTIHPARENAFWRFKNQIRDILTKIGADEVTNYSFIDQNDAGLRTIIQDNRLIYLQDVDVTALQLKNPIAPEMSYLRSSLIPGLVKAVTENAKRFDEFTLFEINPVTIPQEDDLPDEPILLAVMHYSATKSDLESLLHVKAIWRTLIESHHADGAFIDLEPLMLSQEPWKKPAFAYEVDLRDLITTCKPPVFQPIPLSPATKQDISFIIDVKQPVGGIVEEIKKTASSLKEVSFVDQYQNAQMQKSQQHSITLRLTFQEQNRSLADAEINPIRQQIESMLQEQFSATIR